MTVQQHPPQTLKHPAQGKLSNTNDQLAEKVRKKKNNQTAQTTSTAQLTTTEDTTNDRNLPMPSLPLKKDDKPKKSTHKKWPSGS